MLKSDKVRIQYASKYASSANYWKNAIGMNEGLVHLKVLDTKKNNRKSFWLMDVKRVQTPIRKPSTLSGKS